MKQNNYDGALQQPLHSGFSARSTSADVIHGINLQDKVVIVTGGNTGIGLETTKALASAGATVIVPARDVEKAKTNLRGVPNVEVEVMDLMDHRSIDGFAQRFLASGRSLHLLINNAGIMWVPLRRDKRGYESQLVTNYLAQFQLTARLWPALMRAGGARVVNVSSAGHQFAPFHFEDPNFVNRDYQTLAAYGQSKTATNLFTVELDARGQDSGVRAYSVHPGSIGGTELAREAPLELFQQMGICDGDGNIRPEIAAGLKTIPQGAATTLWCATSSALSSIGGVYCEDGDIGEILPDTNNGETHAPGSGGVKAYSVSAAQARKLWELTEQLTGISFDPSSPKSESRGNNLVEE